MMIYVTPPRPLLTPFVVAQEERRESLAEERGTGLQGQKTKEKPGLSRTLPERTSYDLDHPRGLTGDR